MPDHNHHHVRITIATAPFRAKAGRIICGVPALRRFASPPPSDPFRGAVTGDLSSTLSNME